jgi:hypothetical protein
MLEKKLLEEVKRFNAINKYSKKMIMEQDVPPPPTDAAAPPTGDVPPPPTDAPPTDAPAADPNAPAGLDAPTDTPPAGDTEEIDITDLVDMVKSVKKDIENKQNDNTEVISKMDDVFTKLNDLESKLGEMDQLMSRIDQLGSEVQQMKPQTPQEKLEMRSLDSYPFNEKPQEFFAHKQGEMRASGKNEYVLTKDDVQNYQAPEIKGSFNPDKKEDEHYYETRY